MKLISKPDFINLVKYIVGNVKFHIFAVALIAIIIRSIPAWTYKAWGDDFGIYYGLTNAFIENKKLFPDYKGWGNSYQYFPMLYIITSIVHYITRLEISILLPKIAPIFGGLTAPLLYLIVYNVTRSKYISLLAASLLAINPIHIFQTSKPYPLTIGHFFLLLLIYVYIKSYKSDRYYYLLFLLTPLLVMSHHLTTYIFIISFLGMFITIDRDKEKKLEDLVYGIYLISISFIYWMSVARPVSVWIEEKIGINTAMVMTLCIIFIISIYLFITKYEKVFKRFLDKLFIIGDAPDLYIFIFYTLLTAVLLVVVGIYGVGAVNLNLNPLLPLQASPTIVTIGFGVVGIKYCRKYTIFLGWFIAIFISMLIATIVWSRVLFPERHLEYFFEVFSIFSGVGLYVFLKNNLKHIRRSHHKIKKSILELSSGETNGVSLFYTTTTDCCRIEPIGSPQTINLTSRKREPLVIETKSIRINYRKFVPAAIVLLFVSNLVLSHPIAIEHYYPEGISEADWLAIMYLVNNASRNYTIATDHRLGTILNSTYGFYVTFDKAIKIWTQENLDEYIDELQGKDGEYPPILYILIDNFMVNGSIVLIDNGPHGATIIIKNWNYEKFKTDPFRLIYRVESDGGKYWAEIYLVDWEKIGVASSELAQKHIIPLEKSPENSEFITNSSSILLERSNYVPTR